MGRDYFYKERGKMLPYHYCSECGKQYKDDEFKAGLIVNVGSNSTPIKYCAKPCLLIKFPPPSLDAKKKGNAVEEEIDPKDLE